MCIIIIRSCVIDFFPTNKPSLFQLSITEIQLWKKASQDTWGFLRFPLTWTQAVGHSPTQFRSVHSPERLGPSWVRASSPTWKWQSRELWKPRSWAPRKWQPNAPPQVLKRMVHLENGWLFCKFGISESQGPKLSCEPWGKILEA